MDAQQVRSWPGLWETAAVRAPSWEDLGADDDWRAMSLGELEGVPLSREPEPKSKAPIDDDLNVACWYFNSCINGFQTLFVQEALGHATISVTANVYGHLLPELQKDAAKRMDRALKGPSKS